MGCSSSPTVPTYTVSYCALEPIPNKANFFKIKLIAEEEIQKKSGVKFLSQCGLNKQEQINQYLDRENFQDNTIFYYFQQKESIIKNLYQSLNFQPYNYVKLSKIFLLSIEGAKPIPLHLIEKKTKDLPYFKFIGEEIDLDDMAKRLDEINKANISKDDISLNEAVASEVNEEKQEKDDEIIISNKINKEIFDSITNNDKCIKSAKLFSNNIEDISTFIKLMTYLEEKKIKKFSFFDNNLNTDFEGWDSIYDLLDKNYSIRYVDMHNCKIDDNRLSFLIRALSDKRIRFLNLSKNFLSFESAILISEVLKNNKTLQVLNLSSNSQNQFKCDGVRRITESLIENPNIQIINLSNMNLTGCGEFIGNFLSKNKNIQIIYIRNVQLNANDFKNIFENIKTNNTIKEIDVSMNDMGGDKSLEYIAGGIKENKSLNTLKMDKININNDNYKIIFDAIEKANNINSYSVSHNSKISPKIMLEFFIKQMHVKNLVYEPYDKNNPEDRNKELSLDEKKIFDKFKAERPDMKIINK